MSPKREQAAQYLARYQQLIAEAEQEEQIEALAQMEHEAYRNAYESMFDGLKIVSTPETALTLTLPMVIKPNVYYLYEGHLYVGIADTIASEANFADVLVDMEASAV